MEHKIVNGEVVALTAEEAAQREVDVANWETKKKQLEAQRAEAELKALAQEDLLQKHIVELETKGTPEQKAKIAELKQKQEK